MWIGCRGEHTVGASWIGCRSQRSWLSQPGADLLPAGPGVGVRQAPHPPTGIPGSCMWLAGKARAVARRHGLLDPRDHSPVNVLSLQFLSQSPEHSSQTWAARSLRGDVGAQDHLCQQAGSRGAGTNRPRGPGPARSPSASVTTPVKWTEGREWSTRMLGVLVAPQIRNPSPSPCMGGRHTGGGRWVSFLPSTCRLTQHLAWPGRVPRGRSMHRAGAQLLWELGPPEQQALCTRITFAVREARPPSAPAMQLRL